MRIFLAHPKSFNDEEIDLWTQTVKEQFRSEYPDLEVVPGRDDYFQNAPTAGTWKAWAQDVVTRIDGTTREPWYDVIVSPHRLVGGATRLIAAYALHANRPVLIVEENQNDMGARIEIARVREVVEIDGEDYHSGWLLET